MEFTENSIRLTGKEADNLATVLNLARFKMGGSMKEVRANMDAVDKIDEVLRPEGYAFAGNKYEEELEIPAEHLPLIVRFGRVAVLNFDWTLDEYCRDAVGDYIGHCVPGLISEGRAALATARAIVDYSDRDEPDISRYQA